MRVIIEKMKLSETNLTWQCGGVFYARDIDPKALDTEAKRVEFVLNELAEITEEEAKDLTVEAHQEDDKWIVDDIAEIASLSG
jgi:hypothetical protein